MTESLRDRIENIIYLELDYPGDNLSGHLADVICRELDFATPCLTQGCRQRQIARKSAAKRIYNACPCEDCQ